MSFAVRVGTAGWALPRAWQDRFPQPGMHLQRYAARLSAVEINSSFHRPHRRETYERWAASVGPDFRFAVKLPRTITHERRLAAVDDLLETFVGQAGGLAEKLGVILIQLPPSLAFDAQIAMPFLHAASAALTCPIVLEPRHPSWFDTDVDVRLVDARIARAVADPPLVPAAATPGGWRGLTYFRLHGAPRLYWSDYESEDLAAHSAAASSAAATAETWVIYDNTAAGFAIGNALALDARVKHDSAPA